jgi:hypothetical protein
VLGHSGFYPRFGFSVAPAEKLDAPLSEAPVQSRPGPSGQESVVIDAQRQVVSCDHREPMPAVTWRNPLSAVDRMR